MTEPIQYETKPAHAVEAIKFDGTVESVNAITAWYGQFHVEEIQKIVYPQGNMSLGYNDTPQLEIPIGAYVYLDEDGFHVAGSNSFEMYYQEAPEG